jgi:tRNA nucleotidyltransferase/poly(A) polymerase
MEFFFGSVSAFVCMYLFTRFVSQLSNKTKRNVKPPIHSQARMWKVMEPARLFEELIKVSTAATKKTQAQKMYDSLHIKVVISENEAFWIKDNVFYTADIRDQHVDHENARVVDTMTMDDVQLKRISEIVEILREEENNHDSGRSGNKEI